MIVTPKMYARRKLRHAVGYRSVDELTEAELAWLQNLGLKQTEVIGCYRNRSVESPAQSMVIGADSLLSVDQGQQVILPYREIRSVQFIDGSEKSVEADGLLIEKLDGSSVGLTVDDGDDSTGTRDSFMFKTFFENVADG